MTKGCPLILVIEEEASLRLYLRAILQASNYLVKEVATVQESSMMVGRVRPDLVVLDLDLSPSSLNGLAMARDLRGWSRVPIIVVSARDRVEDKVRALDAGADDYLTKPFSSGELVARIRVALRHSILEAETDTDAPVEIGPLKVDFFNREITLDGVDVHLTPNEFALLAVLAKHPGKVVTHKQLLYAISGAKPPTRPGLLLRTHLANLRKKLEPDPAKPHLLFTKSGFGYCLKIPAADPTSPTAFPEVLP